jgi:hypothetical protein
MLREVKRRAKREGKTVMGGLLDIFYSEETAPTLKVQTGKLILDVTTVQVSEGSEGDKIRRPQVYMPAEDPLPEKPAH